MIEYKKTFLKKIKSLLSSFVEFFNNKSILLKIYSENCAINNLNQRLIIMITYNKNTFFINNGQQKIWTLDRHDILCLKKKIRDYGIKTFFAMVITQFIFFIFQTTKILSWFKYFF